MSYNTIIGSKMFLGLTLAPARPLQGISNADPAIASVNGHGFVNGDEVLHFSGWEEFNESVYRIEQHNADSYKLPGYDSGDLDWFPAGTGGGTVQKIIAWQEVTQVLDAQRQGGGPRRITANPISQRRAVRRTVGREAEDFTLKLAFDKNLPAQQTLRAASRRFRKLAFKFLINGGGFAYAYGEVSMPEIPSFSTDRFMEVDVDISMDGVMTFF